MKFLQKRQISYNFYTFLKFSFVAYLNKIFQKKFIKFQLILHEVKQASEASAASRSEMVENSHSLQLCMSFPTHIP